MSKKSSRPATMRPLVIKDLPDTVQIAIKKRTCATMCLRESGRRRAA